MLISSYTENFRQIHERVTDRLSDLSPKYEQMHLNFHLTSVYDHSLHDAFSKVLHKLIDSLPYLEELLNVFCAVCVFLVMLFVFLISVITRIHSVRRHSCLTFGQDFTLQQTHHQLMLRPTICAAITY